MTCKVQRGNQVTNGTTRRDFMNGIAIGAGAGLLVPGALWGMERSATSAAALSAGHYPPVLTGMRGSHRGSFEVAHALAWQGEKPSAYERVDDHYDLVVVGAGFSGLAAARYFQQKMGEGARILILDNHDDFGGHAKRNEFHHNGRMVLNLGGAQMLESYGAFSDQARGLIEELGINSETVLANRTKPHAQSDLNAAHGISITGPDGRRVTITCNWLRVMHGEDDYEAVVRSLPLPVSEQDKLIAFFGGDTDYLDDLSLSEKYAYARSTSYNQFLIDKVGLARETLPLLNTMLRHYLGLGGWSLSVAEAIASAAPGLQGFGWLGEIADNLLIKAADWFVEILQFADGNATIARLMVHKLIPAAAPDCNGFDNVAVSRFDYANLDLPDHPVRLRLNSTAVGVRETGDDIVEVDYVQQGIARQVTADHCILACYNGIIPHLCPQLPDAQKEGLSYGAKVPFIYVNVLLANSRAFSKLDMSMVHCPADPFPMIAAAPTNSSGGFEPPMGPDDPMSILLMAGPSPDPEEGETARDIFRQGRHYIYSTPFETYEQQVRNQLQDLLGPHGFDHETDIKAITVNRIPHGYAYTYLDLDDPKWPEGEAPHEIGRKQFGRISIANSDSEATPLINAAYDAAWRSVNEQTALAAR